MARKEANSLLGFITRNWTAL